MPTNPMPSWSDSKADTATAVPAESPYRLLMRLPDLRDSVSAGALGKLRINWRRRPGSASDRPWWTRVSARWLAASAAALLLVAALLAVLSPPRPGASPVGRHASVADSQAAKRQQPGSDAPASVVPAGYQTADSDTVRPSQRRAPSLMALRPAKLIGSIETLDREARR